MTEKLTEQEKYQIAWARGDLRRAKTTQDQRDRIRADMARGVLNADTRAALGSAARFFAAILFIAFILFVIGLSGYGHYLYG